MDHFSRHRCMVYDGAPSVHLSKIAEAVVEHIQTNYRCLYLNSPTMVAGLRLKIAAHGLDIADTVARGALILSSDQGHLVEGNFHVERMLAQLADGVRRALAEGYQGLWASGDMLWEFGSEKNLDKLLEYELGLERLLRDQPALCGICQYHRDSLPDSAVQVALHTHGVVYLNHTLPRLNPFYRRSLPSEAPNSANRLADMIEQIGMAPTSDQRT